MKNSPEHEYELLSQKTKFLKPKYTSGNQYENRCKNRYCDILALEDTRVHIPVATGTNSDYINANFVNISPIASDEDSMDKSINSKTYFGKPLRFICTQAPMVKTLKDFWMMVWDQNCTVICALNRLIENRAIKGDRYWPENQKKQKSGEITIQLVSELFLSHLDITIRRLRLSYHDSEREIFHLHYEGWPDFGVPKSSLPIRELVRLSVFYQKYYSPDADQGPLVVHCSAGIGRSGSFMVIASIMTNPEFHQLILSENHHFSQKHTEYGQLLNKLTEFRIPDTVLSLRQQRHPGIVQTKQQYKFIYSALVDEIYRPTTVSEACSNVIQWLTCPRPEFSSTTIATTVHQSYPQKLYQSCPGWKIEKENYYEFLEDSTSSNDLAYLLHHNQKTKNIKQQQPEEKKEDIRQPLNKPIISPAQSPEHRRVSSGMVCKNKNNNSLAACQEDRAFLCKSSPMVFVL